MTFVCGVVVQAGKLTVQQAKTKPPMPALDGLKFGTAFAAHMIKVPWTREGGWEAPKIVPYEPLQMSPAAASLHYAMSVRDRQKQNRTESFKKRRIACNALSDGFGFFSFFAFHMSASCLLALNVNSSILIGCLFVFFLVFHWGCFEMM